MTEPLDYGVGDRALVICEPAGTEEWMVVREVLRDGGAILGNAATLKGIAVDSDGRSMFGFFQVTKLIPKVENGLQRK